MLHILLLILKIIGIVLLIIIGALLLGTACALFVPVCYRIEAARQEGEGEPPVAVRIKVTWLFHLINFLFRFDGKVFARARISIITVFRMPKKGKCRKKAEKKEKGEKKQEQRVQEKPDEKEEPVPLADKAEDEQPAETTIKEVESQGSGVLDTDAVAAAGTTETDGVFEGCPEKAEEEAEKTPDKPGFWDKLRAIWEILRGLIEKIKGFFENIQYTINRFCDKIRSVSDTIEYYREVVEGETFKRSFALCKNELLGIAKSVRPRKFEASLIVGMDDPASTGEILAICGMLYPIIGGHVEVRGDFENKRLEGQVLVVGKLRMFTFLRTAVKIYFSKDIRKLYRLLKRRQ